MKKNTLLLVLFFSIQYLFALPLSNPVKKIFAPANDNCSGAITLNVNSAASCTTSSTFVTASFTGATASGVPSSSCGTVTTAPLDVWYQFTATASSHQISIWNVTPFAPGAYSQPIIVAAYSGNCGQLTEIGCSNANSLRLYNLVAGQSYKLRFYFNMISPSLSPTFGICVSTPPIPAGCENVCVNGSFEDHAFTSTSNSDYNHFAVQGWRTLAGSGDIEYWPSNTTAITPTAAAVDGSYICELCSNGIDEQAIYQEFNTPYPTTFNIDFYHRARQAFGSFNTDQMELVTGPPDGPYTRIGLYTTGTGWVHYGDGTTNPVISFMSPAGQPVTRIMFRSVLTAGQQSGFQFGSSTGNLLDNISIYVQNSIVTPTTTLDCNNNSITTRAVGFGTWTPHADNPASVNIANPGVPVTNISGFTTAGTYRFDWGRANCKQTLEIIFQNPEPQTPSITDFTYCQGEVAPGLSGTADPGTTLVWFDSNGTEYITTGPVPNTSAIGTTQYYVVQRNALGCESIPLAVNVIVTPGGASVTGFTIPSVACQSDPLITPAKDTNFANGGTFSATPTGLAINSVSGEINPATSAPGAYEVKYTYAGSPGGCRLPGSSTQNITIDELPVLVNATNLELCDNDYDGLAVFNLTTAGNQVINGQTDVTVTYHTSLTDAQAGTGQIGTPSSFQNTVPNLQTIYIRVVKTASVTNCYAVKTVDLVVHPKPAVPVVTPYVLCDYPATTGNVATFNLTSKDTEATAGVAGLTVTYFDSLTAAQAGTSPIVNASSYNNTATPQTIWVRVQNTFGCYSIGSFTLTVNPLPVVNTAVSDYVLCDDGTGRATFTLSTKNSDVTNGNTTYTVSYYTTQALAEAGGTPLPNSYYTATTTVYARVQTSAGCYSVTSVALRALSSPTLSPVTPLELCETDDTGTAVFNLVPAAQQAVAGASGYQYSYYTSLNDANNGGIAGQISAPATYTSSTGSVFIRIAPNAAGTSCYSVATVSLVVHERPNIVAVSDYVMCDTTAPSKDGTETFNLTSKATEITSDPANTITYYTSNTDAQLNTNPIGSPAAFRNTVPNIQPIYYRVQTPFGCWNTGSFRLVVNPLPDANLTVPVFTSCEEVPGQGYFNLNTITPVITNGQAGYTVAYYVNQSDALAGNANFLDVSVPYLSSDATLYVLVKDAVTGCSIVVSTLLDVQSAPIIPSFPALEECDFNNDNVASFNLQALIDQVVAYFGTGVTVSLHETSEDANFQQGVNPITNLTAYTNVRAYTTNGVQTIYIRVSNAAGCYDVSQAQLIVHPVPVAQDPLEAYHMCDNGVSDTDGQAIFDLTSYNTTVLNGMNAAAFPVSYYASQGDAVAGTNAIPNPATYQSATATVYVRVTNNTTQCYDIVALELVVDPLPVVVQPSPLTQCDINNPGDEKEVFDLTGKITEITTGVNGVNVSFYHTYADALAGSNAIANPAAYTNTVNNGVESIFVRVSNAETGCYRIVILDIRVAPLPVLTMPTPDQLTVCDTNGSGYGSFDLTSLENIMINNGVNLSLTFYQTAYDAANNLNAIQNPAGYTNLNPGVQFVYVVATDATSGCRSQVYSLTLNVSPAPRTVRLNDLTLCDDQDNNGQDNQRVFDLTVQDAAIATQLGVAPGTYTIHYFTTEANALAGAPRITAPQVFMATADGQQIWVRIENSSTDCYQTGSFALRINQPQALAPASMFTKCNDGAVNNQTAVFNLTTKNDYILTPFGIGEGNLVTYYASAADYAANTPIATPEAYSNTSNPQVLFVKVTTPQGCISRSFLTLRVLPQPTPNTTPEALEVCDTNANGYGFEQFNLKNASRRILDNDSNAVISYYETQADALAGTNAIAVTATGDIPYVNTTAWSQTVYARVALAGSEVADPSCVQVVEQVLTVNPMPPIYDPATGNVPNYAICTPNSSGFESFRLMEFVRGVITNAGGNPNDYDIRFYRDNAAYAAGTALPHVYTNTTPNQQTILVYARNFATGCDILTNLTLFADQAAVAHAAASNPWMVCDDDGTNDGMHSFDLTQQDASILAGQSTTMFKVEYYTTQAAALAADTTSPDYIANPAAFVNTSNPQTIWATVKNYLSATPCIDVTSFEVGVELLGEPVISTPGDNHTLCMEYNGGAINPLPLTVNLASGSYTFTWYRDGVEVARDLTATQYNATEPGLYTVIATSTTALGCISEPSATFEVIQSGPAQAIDPNQPYVISAAFSADQTITVLAQGYGEYQYSLGPDGPWQNSNVFTNVPLGYFDIYVRDTKTDNPCTDYVIEGVSIIDYPKFFTPNGDGYNDYWNIQGMTNSGYETARILIYDRYGKLIKQLNPLSRTDQNQGWDGTYNGHPLPSDDYWFTVEFTENGQTREFRAHFALKR